LITIVKYFLMFLFILFLQKYVLEQVPQILPYSRLFLGFVFLIALPPLPTVWLMGVAFLSGLIFDIFYNSPGINASAFVLIAFIKEPLLNVFKDDKENVEYSAHITYLGFTKFFFFALIVSLIFNIVSEFLSVFTFSQVGQTIVRIIYNTILSAILVYIFEIIFFYRRAATK
jgi:hypothetical protein